MPFKLLAYIAISTLALVFIGFNLDNRCDISLAFVTLRQVPIVITILSSFLLGLLVAFLASLGGKFGAKRQAGRVGGAQAAAPYKPEASKSGGGRRKPKAAEPEASVDGDD